MAGAAGSIGALALGVSVLRGRHDDAPDGDTVESKVPSTVSLRRVARIRFEKVQVSGRDQYALSGAACPLAWSPDGRWLLVSIGGSTAILFDTSTWKEVRRLESMTGMYDRAMAFVSNTEFVTDPSNDYARKWILEVSNIESAQPIRRIARPAGYEDIQTGQVTATSSRKYIVANAVRGNHQMPLLFETGNGRFMGPLAVPESPQSYRLAGGLGDRLGAFAEQSWSAVNNDKKIYLLDAATNTVDRTLSGHADHAKSLAWSPDGRLLATGTRGAHSIGSTPIRGLDLLPIWDVGSGKLITSFTEEAESIEEVAWHPLGKILATRSSRSGEVVRLWSMVEKRLIFEHEAQRGNFIYTQSFHPLTGHLVWGRAGALDVFEIVGAP